MDFRQNSMDFRIKVELPVEQCCIRHEDNMMLWGSCFAENIGNALIAYKFRCDMNPFGILYNPCSISKAIRLIADGRYYVSSDLIPANGQWHSLMHHSSFSAADKEECLRRINSRIETATEHLRAARWIIVTWGSARVYEWADTGEIVGNCHKLPERYFDRRLLEVDEIVEDYRDLLKKLRQLNPHVNFLFTISPIRHVRDGLHENQISKSVLQVAVGKICAEISSCFYFPSYEIMMDELRDYRLSLIHI